MSHFTANPKLDPSSTNPRDWAYELACLPATASIVFTKDSFLAFLKTHAIDVSPNYTEINKLPKYAKIGTLSDAKAPTSAASPAEQLAEKVESITTTSPPRVAPAPPPPQQAAAAPAAPSVAAPAPAPAPASVASLLAPAVEPVQTAAPARVITPDGQEFRPTRRVREPIGGGSALVAALFGDAGTKDGGQDDYAAEAARESQRRRGMLQERTQQQEQQQEPVVVVAPKTAAVARSSSRDDDYERASNAASENHFRPTRRVREPGGTGGSSSIALG